MDWLCMLCGFFHTSTRQPSVLKDGELREFKSDADLSAPVRRVPLADVTSVRRHDQEVRLSLSLSLFPCLSHSHPIFSDYDYSVSVHVCG